MQLRATFSKIPSKYKIIGAMLLLYIALFLMHLRIAPYADDIWYIQKMHEWPSFFALMGDFYLTWSGRVVANAIAFLLLGNAFWLWKLLNPLCLLLLAVGIARYAAPKPKLRHICFALILLFLSGPGVLDYGVFWATGSLYYLWPATAAVWLLRPFFQLALEGETNIRRLPVYAILALFACLCNEQITACVLGFMVVALGRYIIKNRRFSWRHGLLLGLGALAAVVLFAAPGSQSRFQQESYLYYVEHHTGFYEVPFFTKIANGVTWSFSMFTSVMYILLMVLFAILWYQLFAPGTGKKSRGQIPLFLILALNVAAALPQQVDFLFTFYSLSTLYGASAAQVFSILVPYVWWGLFLGCLIYMLARHQNRYYLLGFLAALASVAVLFFSPTIYTSGERTLFAASVIITTMLAARTKAKLPWPAVAFTACIAAFNVARLLSRLQLFYA